MIQSICLFLLASSPSIELQLDRSFQVLKGFRKEVADDGSILIAAVSHLYHWSENGRLIQALPPGGLSRDGYLGAFHYDPKNGHYWLIDSMGQRSMFFDKDGQLIAKMETSYRDFMPLGSRLFAVMDEEIDPWERYQPLLKQIDFNIANKNISLRELGEPFYKPTQRQIDYLLNFKRHWLVQDGYSRKVMIVNEVSPEIRIFELPKQGNPGLSFTGKKIPLDIPDWKIPLHQKLTKNTDVTKLEVITGFFPLGSDYVLSIYLKPTEERPESVALQRVGKDGRALGEMTVVPGQFIDIHNGHAYILAPGDQRTSLSFTKHDLLANTR